MFPVPPRPHPHPICSARLRRLLLGRHRKRRHGRGRSVVHCRCRHLVYVLRGARSGSEHRISMCGLPALLQAARRQTDDLRRRDCPLHKQLRRRNEAPAGSGQRTWLELPVARSSEVPTTRGERQPPTADVGTSCFACCPEKGCTSRGNLAELFSSGARPQRSLSTPGEDGLALLRSTLSPARAPRGTRWGEGASELP